MRANEADLSFATQTLLAHLYMVRTFDTPEIVNRQRDWCEGYMVGLTMIGAITPAERDRLRELITNAWQHSPANRVAP